MNDVMRNAYDETFKVQALIKSFGPKSVISIANELGIPDSALYRWRSNDDLMAKARAKKMQLELEKTVGNTRRSPKLLMQSRKWHETPPQGPRRPKISTWPNGH